jgi:hypothetical protein
MLAARVVACTGRRERPSRWAIAAASTTGVSLNKTNGAKAVINRIAAPVTAPSIGAGSCPPAGITLAPRVNDATITNFERISAARISTTRLAMCAVAGQM